MRYGLVCRCAEAARPMNKREWFVTIRNPEGRSWVTCLTCKAHWPTRADYVNRLSDHDSAN